MTNKKYLPMISEIVYKNLLKKIFFRIEPETIHNVMVKTGDQFGKSNNIKRIFSSQF